MVNWKKWFLEEDEDEIFEEEVSRKEKKDDSLAGKERHLFSFNSKFCS